MDVITEAELREMWRNGQGTLPSFPAGVRFSASAQDFLKSHALTATIAHVPVDGHAGWDKPGTFPVVLSGAVPVCAECGQPVHAKPDHMTQLDAATFAPKTAPRLKLRGRIDSLHAFVMLAAAIARRAQPGVLAAHLDTLAAYCREIMSAEYHARPVAPLTMAGMDEAQLHAISHWPDRYLAIDHIVPGAADHEIVHWLNVVRTQAREVEVVALEAFVPTDLAHALNRLSSAVYVLELMLKAGKL